MTFENNEIHVSFTHKIFIVISLVITKKGNHQILFCACQTRDTRNMENYLAMEKK